jgi:hypothetical protein
MSIGVFHYLFICIYVVGWESNPKRLSVLEIFKVSSIIYLFALIWWAGKVHAKRLAVLEICKERRPNSCSEQCHIPPLP